MRKTIVIVVVAVLALAGAVAYNRNGSGGDPASGATAPGGGRGGAMRPPMPVEFATVRRVPLAEQILVVGNLIGAATVEVVPKVNGRVQGINVRLGDSVRRGQTIAKIEDFEIQEQVRQAAASYQVAQAQIRQREADLKLAKTNLDRSRSLYERELLPQQTFDDTEARYQAALAQLDLARAQFEQARARLDELKITLSNTVITSPVNGFVGKRLVDPGAFVGPNSPIVQVVDLQTVRMVANMVERDVSRVSAGTAAAVEVDAFPGEQFKGRVSRVAPVFDPATRTAEMEIEVPNPGFRLKPGMYARVQLTVDTRPNALAVPRNALIDFEGRQGVFVAEPAAAGTGGPAPASNAGPAPLVAKFVAVQVGIRDGEHIEVTGLPDGAQIITTGAGALRDGDRIMASGQRGGGGRGPGARGGAQGNGERQGGTR
ncbi:MAG TPA: efflux RND transporter periplasmic adaptor subunit [Vicinamibacterales bacterium]|nr:efflux RND transporter periplasmic adaptor subunit [Vicinamibacterales bacterium]